MSVLGLVPMKGHSERVPGKNIRVIAGRPLFHWVVKALLDADRIDEVVVDTDSDQIEAMVAEAFPTVMIHRRPERLHGDMVPMHDIVTDVARTSHQDHLFQTHATNPMLSPRTIDRAIEAYLRSGDHDSLMSVTPLQSRFFFTDGRPVNHDPSVLARTQDLEPILEENSNIYISSTELILRTGLRVGDRPILFPMDLAEATDIDQELDFQIAEFLLARRVQAT